MASYLHHTATTIYLCCVPALEDSTGASCVGLAGANIQSNLNFTSLFYFKILILAKTFLRKSAHVS